MTFLAESADAKQKNAGRGALTTPIKTMQSRGRGRGEAFKRSVDPLEKTTTKKKEGSAERRLFGWPLIILTQKRGPSNTQAGSEGAGISREPGFSKERKRKTPWTLW